MTLSIGNRLILLFAVLLLGFTSVNAQEMLKVPTDPPDPNVAERVRALEGELERQNAKLDQLQKTLEEQQLTIKALLEKLSGETNPPAAAAVPVTGEQQQRRPQSNSDSQRSKVKSRRSVRFVSAATCGCGLMGSFGAQPNPRIRPSNTCRTCGCAIVSG
jgi:hypothetical protein